MAEVVGIALALAQLISPFLNKALPKDDMSQTVDNLESWLNSMYVFMKEHGHGEGSSCLKDKVKKVRDIAYEIEDVFDEIVLHSPHLFYSNKFTQKARRAAHDVRHGFPHREIWRRSEGIIKKLESLKLQTETLREGSSISASSNSETASQVVSPLLSDGEMIGYTKLKENFKNQLMNREGRRARLAVVGPVGSGKSTFVKNMFWKPKIRGQFDSRAWILVSKDFDAKKVFVDMLKEFCVWRKESYRYLDESDASNKLRKHLKTKRYIIVLDDVWKHEHWDCIEAALPDGLPGSKVIITTRDSNLASSWASSPALELNGLEESEAWSLFCKTAFKDKGGKCPPDLKNYGKKIVERCEGMPLAIVAVASTLAEKGKLPIDWERCYDGLGSEIGIGDRHLSVISRALQPSYMDLSNNHKNCLLYFSIFPEAYSVERGRLIRLWAAERLAIESGGKPAEEVAEEYLKELIHRNLVYVSDYDFDGRPRTCRVFYLVRTFIVQKCKDHNLASSYPRENSNTTQKMRRLSVLGDSPKLLQDIDIPFVRSMFLFRRGTDSASRIGNHFKDFSLLKVLDLQSAPLDKFPDQITCLRLLIYLSLRDTAIKNVPKAIKKLNHLETLDLKHSDVRELPQEIYGLHNLRHLFSYKKNVENFVTFHSVLGARLFEGIGKLSNLQKLSLVRVGRKGSIIKELKHTTQLRKLGLVGLREEHCIELCESLGHLKHISTLDLHANTDNEFLEVGDLDNLNHSIRKLYLNGRLRKVPGRISSLDNLQRIGLKWTKLAENQNPLENIKHLRHLTEIQLVDSYEGEELEFEASTFQKLKILLIENFSALNTVRIQEGALPELKKMSLRRCSKLLLPPLGLHNLAKIEELVMHDMPAEFIDRLRKNGEDRDMVERILVVHSITFDPWSLEDLSGSPSP